MKIKVLIVPLYNIVLRPKTVRLWYPDSPGVKVTVTRTWGRPTI